MIDIDKIKKVVIVGSGTLGARIGLQAALSGYDVTLHDINEKAFVRAKKEYERIGNLLHKIRGLSKEVFDQRVDEIIWTTDLKEACDNADFISESVVEDPELKQKVWVEIENACPEHTLFTTNTSFLLPSVISAKMKQPERFCAFHFHDVFTARVVDVMPHPTTNPEMVPALVDIGKKLNQIPVVIQKETEGFIFNKMFSNILFTAGTMLAEGIASKEDIDRSWMGNYNMRIGPFGMMDEAGLDTMWHVMKNHNEERKSAFMLIIEDYIKAGKLGIKSGEGFYRYPKPAYKAKDFLQ